MMELANHRFDAVAEVLEPAEDALFAFPTSISQTRLWKLHQLRPGNPAYNVAVRFRLEGELDVHRLQHTINEIIRRHEVLRATFRLEEGELRQIIAPSVSISVPVIDIRPLPDGSRQTEVDRLSLEEAQRPFDVSAGPLFRASLLQISDLEHMLLVTAHHLVADGWSVGLITNELGAMYEALGEGREPALPELPIQYPDFAVWQKEWLQDIDVKKQLDYWVKQLQGLTTLRIPTDRPRPASQTFHGAIVSTVLPRNLTDAIQQFSSSRGGTFFVTVLSGFKLLLHLYSRQNDIGIGTQVAGRNRVELENLVGLFINTVVLRTDVSGDPTFNELMERVQETAFQSIANQDAPFERVLAALAPEPDPARNPLFHVNFICQRDFVKPLQFSGLKLTAVPSKSQGALYDLNVFLVERPDGWRLSCEYSTDLYEQATAENILHQYRSLLERVIESPEKRISEYRGIVGGLEEPRGATVEGTDGCVLPASLCQRRFALLDQLIPGNPAFNMPVALRLRGQLDLTALQESVNDLILRHETLRTAFGFKDGEPEQLVASHMKVAIELHSVEHVTEGDREVEANKLLEEYARLPFDLGKLPLLRIQLVRLAVDHYFFILTMPHIICDGCSNGILVRELWTLYESRSRGASAALPEIPIHYGDYAHSESEWLQTDTAQESLIYWKTQLRSPLPILNVFTDRPAIPGKIPRGGMETILFPAELTVALKNLCKREHATMFVVCLAAFKVLLHHYTGHEDILVGSPVANRTPETEGVVGPFSNPLCLRTDLSGSPSFSQLLQRVRSVTFEALDHKDLPFERILQEVRASSGHGRSSLFQFYFFYQVAFLQPIECPGLSVTPLATLSPGASFEWQLGMIERREGLRAQLQYNADLYEASTIVRVLRHLQTVLETVVVATEQPIQQILMLSEAEQQLFAAWRRTRLAVSDRAASRKEYVGPRNATERKIAGIWEQALGIKPISVQDSLFDVGGHSLQVAELLVKIERSLDKKFPIAVLFACPTIEQMAWLVDGKIPIPSANGLGGQPVCAPRATPAVL